MGAGEHVIHEGIRSVQSEAKAHDQYRQSPQPCSPSYGLPKTGLLKNLDPNGSKEGAHKITKAYFYLAQAALASYGTSPYPWSGCFFAMAREPTRPTNDPELVGRLGQAPKDPRAIT